MSIGDHGAWETFNRELREEVTRIAVLKQRQHSCDARRTKVDDGGIAGYQSDANPFVLVRESADLHINPIASEGAQNQPPLEHAVRP